jgi:hypothetical protein
MHPDRQLASFMKKYTPAVRDLAADSLERLRAQLPGAVEIVYDNYNALVIGFGPTETTSDARISIALYPKWINLFFLDGAKMRDPKKLLQGSGKQVRSIRVTDASQIDDAAVRALIRQAFKSAKLPAERSIVIKSISKKQRPRK